MEEKGRRGFNWVWEVQAGGKTRPRKGVEMVEHSAIESNASSQATEPYVGLLSSMPVQ